MTKHASKEKSPNGNGQPTPGKKQSLDEHTETTWGSTIKEWVKSILIAIVLALFIRWPVIEPFKIPSGSMEPTFYDGDRIFVNKFVYGIRFPFNGFRIPYTTKTTWYADDRIFRGADPQRWDVVVFKSVEHDVQHDILVKRIVGLPVSELLSEGVLCTRMASPSNFLKKCPTSATPTA